MMTIRERYAYARFRLRNLWERAAAFLFATHIEVADQQPAEIASPDLTPTPAIDAPIKRTSSARPRGKKYENFGEFRNLRTCRVLVVGDNGYISLGVYTEHATRNRASEPAIECWAGDYCGQYFVADGFKGYGSGTYDAGGSNLTHWMHLPEFGGATGEQP